MDRIIIRDLTVKTIIGTLPTERTTPQELVFNIELYLDLAPAGHSDDLRDSVNYQEIEQRIKQLAEGNKFFLLEKMAEESAALCLSYNKIKRVKIMLDKPAALADSRSVAVVITRAQSSSQATGNDNE